MTGQKVNDQSHFVDNGEGEWTEDMERDSWESYEDEYTSYLTYQAIEKYFSFKRNDETHKSVLTQVDYLSDFGRERPIWIAHFEETTFNDKGEVFMAYTTQWVIYRLYGACDDHFMSFYEQEVRREPGPKTTGEGDKQ